MRPTRNSILLLAISGIIVSMSIWYISKPLGFDGFVYAPPEYKFRDVMGRYPTHLEKPSIHSFMSGSFQTNLEKASSDRLPAFTFLIKSYLDMDRYFNKTYLKMLPRSWAPVFPVGGNIIAPWDSSRLMKAGIPYDPGQQPHLIEKANYYHTLAEEHRTCRFFVIPVITTGNWVPESDAYYKGKTNVLAGKAYVTHFASLIHPDIYYDWIGSRLSPDSTMNLFYKSDHHFSMRGAYYVYEQIINALGFQSHNRKEPTPVQRWATLPDVAFLGSYARRAGAFSEIKDNFEVAEFNLPTFSILTSLNEKTHGDQKKYLNGQIPQGLFVDHYAKCFGNGRGLVKYSCASAPEQNILVVGDSFDNPMEPLIASHYRNAYFLELKNYKRETGQSVDISDIISEKDIDDVLFFGMQDKVIGLTGFQ